MLYMSSCVVWDWSRLGASPTHDPRESSASIHAITGHGAAGSGGPLVLYCMMPVMMMIRITHDPGIASCLFFYPTPPPNHRARAQPKSHVQVRERGGQNIRIQAHEVAPGEPGEFSFGGGMVVVK